MYPLKTVQAAFNVYRCNIVFTDFHIWRGFSEFVEITLLFIGDVSDDDSHVTVKAKIAMYLDNIISKRAADL